MEEQPELKKLRAIREQSQEIGIFLDWLSGQGLHLCEMHHHSDELCKIDGKLLCEMNEGDMISTRITTEEILATYFKIDLKKIEKEKRAILDKIRSENNG